MRKSARVAGMRSIVSLLLVLPVRTVNNNIGNSYQEQSSGQKKKIVPFPIRLHRLLENAEALHVADIISWVANGKAFKLHKPEAFLEVIMAVYFADSQLKSFRRQLNFYSISRMEEGPDKGKLFIRRFSSSYLDVSRTAQLVHDTMPTVIHSDDSLFSQLTSFLPTVLNRRILAPLFPPGSPGSLLRHQKKET